jgi:hypothetical protein
MRATRRCHETDVRAAYPLAPREGFGTLRFGFWGDWTCG